MAAGRAVNGCARPYTAEIAFVGQMPADKANPGGYYQVCLPKGTVILTTQRPRHILIILFFFRTGCQMTNKRLLSFSSSTWGFRGDTLPPIHSQGQQKESVGQFTCTGDKQVLAQPLTVQDLQKFPSPLWPGRELREVRMLSLSEADPHRHWNGALFLL